MIKGLVIGLGVVFGVIYVAANEIGKFIDDISPYEYDKFSKYDMGNDFEDLSNGKRKNN